MEIVLDFSVEIDEYNDVLDVENIEKYICNVLNDEFESDKPVYLSVSLVNNDDIQRINRDFRGKDSPTDVISFAYHDTPEYLVGPYDTLGDIVISLEKVEEQSKEYNHSFKREFFYVLTHGILHLLGYDHIDEDDKKEMREREEEILSEFGHDRNS